MSYNKELQKMLEDAGRKKKWLAAKLGFARQAFWRKVSQDKFTDGQKRKIKKLLSI